MGPMGGAKLQTINKVKKRNSNGWDPHMGFLVTLLWVISLKTRTVDTTLQGFLRQVEHFLTDMSNRVEHQKLNQTTAELSFG